MCEAPLMFEALVQTSPSSQLSASPLIVCSCFILQVSLVFTFFCLSCAALLCFCSVTPPWSSGLFSDTSFFCIFFLHLITCLADFLNFVVTSILNYFILFLNWHLWVIKNNEISPSLSLLSVYFKVMLILCSSSQIKITLITLILTCLHFYIF